MDSIYVLLTGFLPMWIAYATMYYKLGKMEQKIKDICQMLNGKTIKKKKRGGEIW